MVGITRFGTTDAPDPAGTVTAAEPSCSILAGPALGSTPRIIISRRAPASAPTHWRPGSGRIAPPGIASSTGDAFRDDAKGSSTEFADFLRGRLLGLLAAWRCSCAAS